MTKKITKKQIYYYGYKYYTNRITIKKISQMFNINYKDALVLMQGLLDDDDFDMASCIDVVTKRKWNGIYKGQNSSSLPEPKIDESKTVFSNDEDDYGYGYWMNSSERYALIEGGLKNDWYLEWMTSLLLNLNNEQDG